MTINREPDGGVSFRVIIGAGGGRTEQLDLLELIIGSDHVAELSRALAAHYTENGGTDQVPPFPCHVGFCRNATNAFSAV